MSNMTASSPCQGVGSFVLPLISGLGFTVIFLLLLYAAAMCVYRSTIVNGWPLRMGLFLCFGLACGLHAARALTKAWLLPGGGEWMEDRMLGGYNAMFLLAMCFVALLCILDARRSRTRIVAICGVVVVAVCGVGAIIGICLSLGGSSWVVGKPMVIYLVDCVLCLVMLCLAIRAGSRNPRYEGAAVIFVFRYMLETALTIELVVYDAPHLDFQQDGFATLVAAWLPVATALVFLWPSREILEQDRRVSTAGLRFEKWLKESGVSVALLAFFYGLMLFIFVNAWLSACEPQNNFGGIPYFFSSAASKVLAQVVPLLLLTTMYGTLTFLKRTVVSMSVPFDGSIAFHYHCAGVFSVMLVMHLVGTVLMGYTPGAYDLWGWTSGFIGALLGTLGLVSGCAFVLLPTRILFSVFIWLHRLGMLLILVVFPIHIWETLVTDPTQFIFYYLCVFVWLTELALRAFFLRGTTDISFTDITSNLVWVDIAVSASSQNFYKAGQWVYLTSPHLAILERHPFTIAMVRTSDRSEPINEVLEDGKEESHLLPVADGGRTTLRFMIRRQSGRGARSWTNQLLLRRNPLKIYVDGPFSSGATAIVSSTVERSILIGLGSGITAPLGIAAGVQHHATLVFVSREMEPLCEVAKAIRIIQAGDPRCLSGGALFFCTAPDLEWPDSALLRVIDSGAKRHEILQYHQRLVHLAGLMFEGARVPPFDEDVAELRSIVVRWSADHSFFHPIDGVLEVRHGRPNWSLVLLELSQRYLRLEREPPMSFRECHVLYTGARAAANEIESFCKLNNSALIIEQDPGKRLLLELHSEVW